MLGSMLHVTTLVLHDLSPMPNMAAIRVQAPTIRLMSIDFADDWWYDSPLEFLTSTFNVPNLEYLELLQAFSPLCSISEFPYGFRLPPEWELEPQFPHLHTLRLQNTALTPGRLALLQVLTRGISELELVDTGGFHHPGRLYRRTAVQLNNSDDEYHLFPVESFDGKVDIPWPSLRSLTIDDVEIPAWLSEFITVRAELRQYIARVTLLPKPYPHIFTFAAPILRNTEIRRHPTRPSLIDSSPAGFFANDADFEHNDPGVLNYHDVEYGDYPPSHAVNYPNFWTCEAEWTHDWPAWQRPVRDQERLEAEIDAAFGTVSREFVRARGMRKDARKERRMERKVVSRSAVRRSEKRRHGNTEIE